MLGKSIVVATVALALTFGLMSCHHRKSPEKMHKHMSKRMIKVMKRKLDLTKDQVQKVEVIAKEIKVKHKEGKCSKDEGFQEVLSQVRSKKIDQEKMMELFEKKHQKMESMKPFMMSKIVEFHEILTPVQRNKLAELMEDHHSKCKN